MNKYWFLFTWLLPVSLWSQNTRLSSSDIYKELQKLENTTTVMYLAAHPDDENTRLISWLTNHENVRTVYLSLTRGDGGQNRIGTEQSEALGVLRTQELLAARSVDGGEQAFTRAKDFGYSKSVDETFTKWSHDEVLRDVVLNIRKFKPDVIITRFPPDKRAGHGHHTASAILAEEAFDIVNDPSKYPESAKAYGVCQPKRILFNTSRWFGEEWINEHLDELYTIDIGEYDPVLGKSYAEIAAIARSQHRCQAFGTAPTYGEKLEYLLHVKGDSAKSNNILEGVVNKWSELEQSKKIQKQLSKLIADYDVTSPSGSLEGLFELRKLLTQEERSKFVQYKIDRINDLIVDCSGLWVEYLASEQESSENQELKTKISVVNLGSENITLKSVTDIQGNIHEIDSAIVNKEFLKVFSFSPTHNSAPYWLQRPAESNLYLVKDYGNIGLPQNKSMDHVEFHFDINGNDLKLTKGVSCKYTDRSIGERYHNPFVLPVITASFSKDLGLFTKVDTQLLHVSFTVNHDVEEELILVDAPKGWTVEPSSFTLKDLSKGITETFEIVVSATQSSQNGELQLISKTGQELKSIQIIDYPHIQKQLLLPKAKVDLVYEDIVIPKLKVGYIHGAGDKVPEMLRQVGVEVELVSLDQINLSKLQEFDAVVAGVRLYNVHDMSKYQPILMEYVQQGGNYVVQYVTTYSLKNEEMGPYSFTLSRDRVTDENAVPSFLNPDHKVLNQPNKIEKRDFNNWVQERGLYFAIDWNEAYEPIIGWHDLGEENVNGGLIISKYGEGYFTYTGISFFRELPAGVPGAYKLMINLLALSN